MSDVFSGLIIEFERDVTAIANFLVSGGVKSFDEYKEAVGKIRGLRSAIQTTKDMQQILEQDVD